MQLYFEQSFQDAANHYQSVYGSQVELIGCQKPFSQKFLKALPKNTPILLLDAKGLSLALFDGQQTLKVKPDWLAQQRRVVSAGKKTESLLKASKISADMHVIDATAGLGHDAILMAGRGALVTMLESSAAMHLLLIDAMAQISEHKNWQKLHARLSLLHTDATEYLLSLKSKADLVYLDPMFPEASYGSAQVNKNMQMLHAIAKPPTLSEEEALLNAALKAADRVLVKRPRHAPYLAMQKPQNQWLGDVIRFDAYEA